MTWLKIKSSVSAEKDKIAMISTKLELLNHLLSDSEDIKEAVAKAANKIERRLAKLEELLSQTQKLNKRFL